MKKLLKKSLIILMLMVMLPLSSFLVACGATPGEEAFGVMFDSQKYDEETGKAIFEVDLGVPTKLPIMCNPSTAKDKADYTIPVEGQTNAGYNRSRFTFEKGVITVNYDDFEPVEIRVTVGEYTDQCIVRLKEYPIAIKPEEAGVVLCSGSSYTIKAIGVFEVPDKNDPKLTVTEERLISEEDYKFKIISSNEQVIDIPNESRLNACSIQSGYGSSKVTVSLLDQSNKPKDISFDVNFTVVEIAKQGFLIFDGFDKFVEDGGSIKVDANVMTENANGEYELNYTAMFVSELNTYIQNVGSFRGASNDNRYVTFDNENQKIKVKSTVNLDLKVTIYTDLYKYEGGKYSTLQINFDIKFIAKTGA